MTSHPYKIKNIIPFFIAANVCLFAIFNINNEKIIGTVGILLIATSLVFPTKESEDN